MEPVRTCLGCRIRADKSTLLRVITRDGEVVADVSATVPGRGAWVHPARNCVESAITRKAFSRALRVDATLKTGQILNTVQIPNTVAVSTEAHEEQAD